MADSIVRLFMDLAEIPSPTDEEANVGQYILRRLRKTADIVRLDRHGNVFARLEGEGTPVFFTSHMDTVRPGGKFRARIVDGSIVSDGHYVLGADDKAGIAAIIDAMERLRRSGARHRPIEAAFTKSEEIGSYGAVYFDYKLAKAREGFCLDSNAPVGEIVVASPYYNSFQLTIQGRSAHASKPESGRNALLAFKNLLNELQLGRINPLTVANIGIVRTGEVRNAIPGVLTAEGEVRSFHKADVDSYKSHLVTSLERMAKSNGVSYKIHFDKMIPGYHHGKGSKEWKLVELAKTSMRKAGVKPVIKRPWESTDTNIFMQHGISCIVLAHGSENAHTPKERIRISELRKLSETVVNIVSLR